MRVLLAGATGVIGRPLIRSLRAAGDEVIGIARSTAGVDRLAALGVVAVRADVTDREALLRAVQGHRADAVINQLTALKRTPLRHRDMAATNDLRVTGTRHLIDAAQVVGAHRFVTQSIVFGYGYTDHGGTVLTEGSPFGVPAANAFDPHVAAMVSTEQQTLGTAGLDGVALRYGLFYGGDLADLAVRLRRRALPVAHHGGVLAFVHHDDAAAATVAALHHAPAGGVFNVVDDEPATFSTLLIEAAQVTGAPKPLALPGGLLRLLAPYGGAVMTQVSLQVSNAKARDELGWEPSYPSYRDGLRASWPAAG